MVIEIADQIKKDIDMKQYSGNPTHPLKFKFEAYDEWAKEEKKAS